MKPILFSTEMVRAILSDRKTMTRRVIKDNDIINHFDIDVDGSPIAYIDQATGDSYPPTIRARYQVGEILWVQETWKVVSIDNMRYQMEIAYKDGEIRQVQFTPGRWHMFRKFKFKNGWQSPYFMPREAARIFLRVTNVRVERLQDISEEDARAEGCITFHDKTGDGKFEDVLEFDLTARDAFCELWQRLNLKRGYGWETNPWVWVYEFERVSEDV
jgi:hypothetical protein